LDARYVPNVNNYVLVLGAAHYWPIEKLKEPKSSGIDQIPAELIEAGSRTIHYEIHKLIISVWNEEELPKE